MAVDARIGYMTEELGNNAMILTLYVLSDNFKFSTRKLNHFFAFMLKEREKWQKDDVLTSQILNMAKERYPYIYDNVYKVQNKQLLQLAGYRRSDRVNAVQLMQILRCALILHCSWVDNVLKEHYKMSVEYREAFMIFLCGQQWNDDGSDVFGAIKYVCDKTFDFTISSIKEYFIKEKKWDLDKGVKV